MKDVSIKATVATVDMESTRQSTSKVTVLVVVPQMIIMTLNAMLTTKMGIMTACITWRVYMVAYLMVITLAILT